MEFIPKEISYPDGEKSKIEELLVLFEEWYNAFKNKSFIKNSQADDMVFDGFYPYYFSQKKKILFIGRESLDLYDNFLSILYKAYKEKNVADKHINSHGFHRKLFYIAYGILNSFPQYSNIPFADELSEKFAIKDGISFAYMNISKFTHVHEQEKQNENWIADWELIDSFVEASCSEKRNFIHDEINILDPDIIITMNFINRYPIFEKYLEVIEKNNDVNSYYYLLNNRRKVLLLDTFHFSAVKSDENSFYKPIIESVQKYFK